MVCIDCFTSNQTEKQLARLVPLLQDCGFTPRLLVEGSSIAPMKLFLVLHYCTGGVLGESHHHP